MESYAFSLWMRSSSTFISESPYQLKTSVPFRPGAIHHGDLPSNKQFHDNSSSNLTTNLKGIDDSSSNCSEIQMLSELMINPIILLKFQNILDLKQQAPMEMNDCYLRLDA